MTPKVVANSTPLIALARINRFHLLQELFSKIFIPEAVYDEVVSAGRGKAGDSELRGADWIYPTAVKNSDLVDILRITLDAGEAEAIALAKESRADLLIIDDGDGRRMAKSADIAITGTVGILMRYYRDDAGEFQDGLNELLSQGFRLSDKTVAAIINQQKVDIKARL